MRYGQRVNIAVADRTGDDYVPPPKKLKPFAGHGNRLGSVDPDAPAQVVAAALQPGLSGSATTAVAAPTAAPASAASSSAGAVSAAANSDAPTTSIQLRLADGTRCAGRGACALGAGRAADPSLHLPRHSGR